MMPGSAERISRGSQELVSLSRPRRSPRNCEPHPKILRSTMLHSSARLRPLLVFTLGRPRSGRHQDNGGGWQGGVISPWFNPQLLSPRQLPCASPHSLALVMPGSSEIFHPQLRGFKASFLLSLTHRPLLFLLNSISSDTPNLLRHPTPSLATPSNPGNILLVCHL